MLAVTLPLDIVEEKLILGKMKICLRYSQVFELGDIYLKFLRGIARCSPLSGRVSTGNHLHRGKTCGGKHGVPPHPLQRSELDRNTKINLAPPYDFVHFVSVLCDVLRLELVPLFSR